jgi:DnaJ-class molecular chaperone
VNAHERQLVRQAVDQRARNQRHLFLAEVARKTCTGCQGDLDNQTYGCNPCHDRQRRRERRDRLGV